MSTYYISNKISFFRQWSFNVEHFVSAFTRKLETILILYSLEIVWMIDDYSLKEIQIFGVCDEILFLFYSETILMIGSNGENLVLRNNHLILVYFCLYHFIQWCGSETDIWLDDIGDNESIRQRFYFIFIYHDLNKRNVFSLFSPDYCDCFFL